ncbi:hypothetical protein [Psychromonas sp. MME2]|uniref:hypothetical protein n=1 Tax=unclassified Psychromonas TaxID=2614957 RepID=UPI00339BABEF
MINFPNKKIDIPCCLINIAIYLALSAPTLSFAEVVLVNQPLSAQDQRYDYPHRLLSAILKITEPQYGITSIEQSRLKMSRARTLKEMQKGVNIHVFAEATTPLWEDKLIPIRIPIRKGIQGYRVFLILAKNQAMLSNIKTVEQLKSIPTGSGTQWISTKILEKNDFNIVLGNNYNGLFSMLFKERFITFMRGINESEDEYNIYKVKCPELRIEKDLLLYTVLPTYFFVTPAKPELAKRIEAGLQMMISDGSFDKMFNDEFAQHIKSANLAGRRLFVINNPDLTPQTPLNIKTYWYHPSSQP